MTTLFTWFPIAFGALTVFSFGALFLEHLRARRTRPRGEAPLDGMTFGDVMLMTGYIIPILLAAGFAIHNVLT